MVEQGTITRRLDSVFDDLDQEFASLCSGEDLAQKMAALKAAGAKSNRPSLLAELFDLLDSCGIPYERGRGTAYYEALVRRAALPGFSEIEDKMLYELFVRYEAYPAPEDYMERIVDRMASREDGWETEPLRVRILKQFIKYGDYLSAAGFNGRKVIQDYVKGRLGRAPSEADVLQHLDDGVFSGLETAARPQRKPEGKFGLLKLADDLASGKFRGEGATKRSLYLFAMVFGMTYYAGGPDEIVDYRSDIEKNLFRDYYTNNLMRFLSALWEGRLCEYELDPSGQGINYKNFAEMIYLYYIAGDFTPQEKIRRSHEMIRRVQERQFRQGRPEEADRGTGFFRGRVFRGGEGAALFSEDLLRLPEEEFEDFLCTHYHCDTYTGTYQTKRGPVDGRAGAMQLEAEQRTAFENYRAILRDLEELGMDLECCNYGLWFADVAAFRKEGYQSICDRRPDVDREKFERFMDLLMGANSFLGYTAEESVSRQSERQEWTEPSRVKTKALFVDSPQAMTRTSMLVAYYYYFNALHERDRTGRWRSFKELFACFKQGIDGILERSFYQPLSGKDLLDVLTVFSSYAYLNL